MTKPFKVLIIDNHPVFRRGLNYLIQVEKDMQVCQEAENSQQALAAIEKHKPDIAIIDIFLKGVSGLELLKEIRARYASLPSLTISSHEETLFAERVLRSGAKGYLLKQEEPENVIAAIRKVLEGEIFVSEPIMSRLLKRMAWGNDREKLPLEALTDRELEIFRLVGQGYDANTITEMLSVSVKTIASHRDNIKKKMNLKKNSELHRMAVQWLHTET